MDGAHTRDNEAAPLRREFRRSKYRVDREDLQDIEEATAQIKVIGDRYAASAKGDKSLIDQQNNNLASFSLPEKFR